MQKPQPKPLFNYRKRERHALVSDPQKIAKRETNDDETDAAKITSSSASNITSYNNSNCNNYHNNTNINRNQSFPKSGMYNNRPNAAVSKPSSSYPKLPGLMNHHPGVSNRKTITAMSQQSPSPGSKVIGNGGYKFTSNQNKQQSFPVKKSAVESTVAKSNTEKLRGVGNFDGVGSSGQNQNPSFHFSSSHSSSANYANNFQSGAATPGRSATAQWPNTSLTTNRSNYANASNNNNSNWNVIKLQSGNGNVNTTRHGNTKFSSTSYLKSASDMMHPISLQSRGNTTKTQLSNHPGNNPTSIFDEEDVAVEHPLKQQVLLDTSLHIFTCPIRDIRSWSEADVYDGLVLFEVYGLIISGPTDIESGLGKEFYLRDQSSTIRCIFYEIDREMPDGMKGQVHRVIGSMDRKHCEMNEGGYLRVVSVRKADKAERQACQKATEVSLHEMDRLARQLDKEQ